MGGEATRFSAEKAGKGEAQNIGTIVDISTLHCSLVVRKGLGYDTANALVHKVTIDEIVLIPFADLA
ncbi:MAG TPA: hypothetical protein VNG69_13955 [Casimicrobiaceae bacterium]|nr:hypothetical protein [Casimicrobiaceae bacterium]